MNIIAHLMTMEHPPKMRWNLKNLNHRIYGVHPTIQTCLIVLVLVVTRQALAQNAADKVFCPQPEMNFGVVPPGTKVSHTFVLVNPTKASVMIRAVKPTCQCTTAESVEGKEIPAGGTLEMPVTMQVPSTTGQKNAAVNILLSTGAGPRLVLRAEAAYMVRTIPPYVDAFQKPQNMKGDINLISNDGQPFKVLSVAGREPVFKNNAGAGSVARKAHTVSYDLGVFECATMPKWILIETDHPKAPLVEMRVRHECTKLKHQLQPGSITLNLDGWIANTGRITPGGQGDFTVEIKQFKNMKIDSVQSLDPRFRATLLEQKPGDGDRVQVRVLVQPITNVKGVFQIPVQMTSGRRAESIFVVGTVR